MSEAFISMSELANRLGYSPYHLYRIAAQLNIPKRNGRWEITEALAKKLEKSDRNPKRGAS